MKTELLDPSPASLARAAALLRDGRLVAFPTETVYGLGARADEARAVAAIFAAKGRPSQNPLIVHVASVEAARALAAAWSDEAERLARAFWPGPLTLVLARRRGAVADEVAASGPTVAVRVPEHPVARALLDAAAVPVAAPSANLSTSISPTSAAHVLKSLGGRIDAVLDGGVTGYGIESAIVDVSCARPSLLRHGALSLAALAAQVPIVDRGALAAPDGTRLAAPGGYARHYAPAATVVRVPAEAAIDEARARVAAAASSGQGKVGLLAWGALGRAAAGAAAGAQIEVLPGDPVGYAAGLYAALHRLEDTGCAVIVVAEVPGDAAWAAVQDRLRRASA
jgi:L-threonylcarbamoyladenylate synthase